MWPTRPHCDKDVRNYPDSYVHMANMGATWVLSAPYVPHVGPMNLESGYVYFWSEFECAWPVNKVGCVVAHSPVFCVIQFFHPPHTPCSSSCLWKVRLTPLGGLTRNNSKWQLALVFYKGRAYEWQCKAGQHVQDVVHVGLSQGDGLRPCVWPQDPWQPQKLQLCCGCALDCEGTVCSAQCHTLLHYKLRAVIMPSVSSLIARHVGFMTICGANSVDEVGIMTLKTKSCFDTNFCTTGDAVRDKKVGIVINIGFQYGCSTAPTEVKRELFLYHICRDHLFMRLANERRRYIVVCHWHGAYTKWCMHVYTVPGIHCALIVRERKGAVVLFLQLRHKFEIFTESHSSLLFLTRQVSRTCHHAYIALLPWTMLQAGI